MRTVLLLIVFTLSTQFVWAGGPNNLLSPELLLIEDLNIYEPRKTENRKLVAAVLAITLGPFGGHRLYLGTKPAVPMVYVATLGGGFFILPLIDLGHILFSKDLSRFENNSSVFMWRKSEVPSTLP